ncbi:MAG: GTP cyclohydrolase I FolE [Candidatus Kapaibacteriales bacterium]
MPNQDQKNQPIIDPMLETPISGDYHNSSSDEKIKKISNHFFEIMTTLGLDMEDDSLKGTPRRFAKMYVNELFAGLDQSKRPKITTFENRYNYSEMLIEKNVKVLSCCEHHFMPFIGKAHVAYMPEGRVVGLSKINRLVNYYSRRPQTQERLTLQIADDLKKTLNTENVAVVMETRHLCVVTRGAEDHESTTLTNYFSGKFQEKDKQEKFLSNIRLG